MSPILWALFALAALVLILVALVVIIRGPDALHGLLSAGVRRWLYGLAAAVLALLAGYGIVNGELVDLWLIVLAGLLDVARRNAVDPAPPADYTPTHSEP